MALIMSSCANDLKKVTNSDDYNNYLELAENKTLLIAEKEVQFWKNKLDVHSAISLSLTILYMTPCMLLLYIL